jgi:hypothetical protein
MLDAAAGCYTIDEIVKRLADERAERRREYDTVDRNSRPAFWRRDSGCLIFAVETTQLPKQIPPQGDLSE